MRWEGGKGGRLVRWEGVEGWGVVRWQGGKGGKIVRVCKRIRMFGLKLVECQLAIWAENAVKFKLKLIKNGRESKTKTRWVWNGKQNVGSFIPIFHDFAVFLQIFSKL